MTTTPPQPPAPKPVVQESKPVVVQEPKLVEDSQEKKDMLKNIQDILKEHDGLEGSIPITSKYWDLLNRYRMLR